MAHILRHTTRRLSLQPLLEPLEPRSLLSVVIASTGHFTPTRLPSAASTVSAAPLFLGTNINAFSYQPFTAVLGTIRNLPPIPAGYTLSGQISWGDSSLSSTTPTNSPATLLHNPDGSLSVLGSHDYLSTGSYKISITIAAFPPAKSLAPVRLLGIINSSASVSSTYNGLTLQPSLHSPFTATLGSFRSNASLNNLTGSIDWGDGTTSTGKILALPSADPTSDPSASPIAGGLFAVSGSHTYSSLGSYLINVTITSPVFPPPLTTPATTPAPTPPIILVFQFTSIADVLPLLATAL